MGLRLRPGFEIASQSLHYPYMKGVEGNFQNLAGTLKKGAKGAYEKRFVVYSNRLFPVSKRKRRRAKSIKRRKLAGRAFGQELGETRTTHGSGLSLKDRQNLCHSRRRARTETISDRRGRHFCAKRENWADRKGRWFGR